MNDHVTDVVTLMEGERPSYRGSLMNDHVTEEVTLMEGGHVTETASNGGKMVMTEVVQFREGEWSLQNWPV